MDSTFESNPWDSLPDRLPRLRAELSMALASLPDGELREWALSLPQLAAGGIVRRGLGLKHLGEALARFTSREWHLGRKAWRQHRLWRHLEHRARETGQSSAQMAKMARDIAKGYALQVAANPREEAPVILAGVLGFAAGSGGLDGDGGLPDMDLIAGIGAHRSLLTHTIVIGVLSETLVLGMVDLAGRVYDHLPRDHDELWDLLDQRDSRVISALLGGVSLGLGYHFAVDATVDSAGSFALGKGIVPPAADDVFQAANALAEGLHGAATKGSRQF